LFSVLSASVSPWCEVCFIFFSRLLPPWATRRRPFRGSKLCRTIVFLISLSKLRSGHRGAICGFAACCAERLRLSARGEHQPPSAPAGRLSLPAGAEGQKMGKLGRKGGAFPHSGRQSRNDDSFLLIRAALTLCRPFRGSNLCRNIVILTPRGIDPLPYPWRIKFAHCWSETPCPDFCPHHPGPQPAE
jgi:hypothetical protein